MRSYNNLYEPMLQDDYIKQRFINASKKKKNRNDVREVLENLDEHTELLKKMLTEELFIPDYHKPSIINESSSKKTRRILKPHYKYEQVIHHCAIGQFKPIVMNGLYEFSCGSIPDRGVHYGNRDCVRCGCGRRIFSDDSVLHLGRQGKQKGTGALL